MTKKEKQVHELICERPSISQNELASLLNLKRSSVASHIRSLISKGYIKGREYILNNSIPITIIGGSNISFYAHVKSEMLLHNSNPSSISSCSGGVARNIAENLSRLERKTRLLSAVGNDFHGKNIISQASKAGIIADDILIDSMCETGSYLSIIDKGGEIFTSVSDMDIVENISVEYIKSKISLINQGDILVLDSNLSEKTLEYIFSIAGNKKIYFHTVSSSKAKRIKNIYNKINTISGNVLDIASLLNTEIKNEIDIFNAIDTLHNNGIKNIYLFGKLNTVYTSYINKDNTHHAGILKINIDKNIPIYEFGMDEAFFSGIIHSDINGLSYEDTLRLASCCRYINGLTLSSVNEVLSLETIDSIINDINISYEQYNKNEA